MCIEGNRSSARNAAVAAFLRLTRIRGNRPQLEARRRSLRSQAAPRGFACWRNIAVVFDSPTESAQALSSLPQTKHARLRGTVFVFVEVAGIEPACREKHICVSTMRRTSGVFKRTLYKMSRIRVCRVRILGNDPDGSFPYIGFVTPYLPHLCVG